MQGRQVKSFSWNCIGSHAVNARLAVCPLGVSFGFRVSDFGFSFSVPAGVL